MAAPSVLSNLKDDIARCDDRHGAGPVRPPLAEWAWRDCVHNAAKQLLLPVVRLPDVYRLLLVEDRRLTEEILAGRVTAQRRAQRLRELAQRIDLVEEGEPLARREPDRQTYGATADEIAAARTYLVEALTR